MVEMQIVDAHHHLWRVQRTPWLAGPPTPRIFGADDAIRRDHLIEEYAADATQHGVVKSIHVQANVASGEEADEVRWASFTGAQVGLVQGVVAFADLATPDVAARLDRLTALPALRGILLIDVHMATRPDLLATTWVYSPSLG
jgi:predicted TIM-barrel fold metal-dependent hydrolase